MEDYNTMTNTMIEIIISAITGEEIGRIIVDRKKNTINKCFNKFIREYFNDKLYNTDIKIINCLSVLYSYYDQTIGNKYFNDIDLFSNEIFVSIVFTDEFIYISGYEINQEEIYTTDSFQNLNNYKKQEINKLLDMLHNQYDYYSPFSESYFDKFYDHIIITKSIAMILLKLDYPFYLFKTNQLNDDFGNDREVVEIAVYKCSKHLALASVELSTDIDIVKIAVSIDGKSLLYTSNELIDDREIVKNRLYENGYSLRFASNRLRNDREIIMLAVLQYGYSLQYASTELRADREIIMLAVLQYGYSLQYASNELRADREIVKKAVTKHGCALEYASRDLRADEEIVKIAVSNHGCALEYASNELKRNREIVKKAILENSYSIQFASNHLHEDIEILKLL